MQSTRILAASAVFDPSKRTVLPASAAVNGPRFRRRDWALSAQVREILDEINLPMAPRPEPALDPAESIIMSGNVIENRMTTGAHVVKQRRVTDLEPLPELAIAEPFVPVVSTARDDAAAALAAINERKPSARRGHRLPAKPSPKAPRGTGTVIVMGVFVVCALLLAAWLSI